MFNKKGCNNCEEKIESKYKFCPYCGYSNSNKSRRNELGMLGENDFEQNLDNFSNSLLGGFGGKMIGKMFESAIKMLEKEMQKEMRGERKDIRPKTNFQLFINGKKINAGNIDNFNQPMQEQKIKENIEVPLPNGILKKFSSLPRKEPETSLRRLSDKIIYEIKIPGVVSEKDISITKLENSIEIRAVSKNNSYQKIIPFNMPIAAYDISKGKLILELESKE